MGSGSKPRSSKSGSKGSSSHSRPKGSPSQSHSKGSSSQSRHKGSSSPSTADSRPPDGPSGSAAGTSPPKSGDRMSSSPGSNMGYSPFPVRRGSGTSDQSVDGSANLDGYSNLDHDSSGNDGRDVQVMLEKEERAWQSMHPRVNPPVPGQHVVDRWNVLHNPNLPGSGQGGQPYYPGFAGEDLSGSPQSSYMDNVQYQHGGVVPGPWYGS